MDSIAIGTTPDCRFTNSASNSLTPLSTNGVTAVAGGFTFRILTPTALYATMPIKAVIYATAAIWEYWALELSAQQMVVFRNPQAGRYVEEYRLGEGSITPLAFADVSVVVERLLA
jgi:hypothetical protein